MLFIAVPQLKSFFDEHEDEKKFKSFAKLCEKTTEKIYKKASTNSLSINFITHLTAIDDDYDPRWLAGNLLDHKKFEYVQLIYEIPKLYYGRLPGKAERSSCPGRYILTVRNSNEIIFGACPNNSVAAIRRIKDENVVHADYGVHYQYGGFDVYGRTDLLDIRPFRFYIEHSKSKEVIAEQNSYQLLLGNMNSNKNRVLRELGSAEGVKVCPQLTKPLDFIHSVFQKN